MKLPDKVIEHFQNPQNVGQIENAAATGSMLNPVCGDITELYLQIKDGVITDAKFKSLGCAVTIASASVFTGKIRGMKVSEMISGSDDEIVSRLVDLIESDLGELPAAKLHCPPATVQAFLEAIAEYSDKQTDTGISSRTRRLIPLLASYFERKT